VFVFIFFLQKQILIGADATPSARSTEVTTMICRHFENLEQDPVYRNATVFVYIESNSSYITADAIMEMIVARGTESPLKFFVVCRDHMMQGRAGVRTDDIVKEAYVNQLKIFISSGQLKIAQNFITTTPGIFTKIEKQLKAYEKIPRNKTAIKNNPAGADIKYRFNGKRQGPDDAATVMLLTLYQGCLMRLQPEYKGLQQAYAWRY
jgi:hypothetical protein